MIRAGVERDAVPDAFTRPALAGADLWASALALGAAVVFSFLTVAPALPRVELQLRLGRLALTGASTQSVGRLGAEIVALLERAGGEQALVSATLLAVLAAVGLVVLRAARLAPAAATTAASVAVLCSVDLLHVGGGLGDLAFAAALLLALEAGTLPAAAAATLLAAVWCNVSPEGLLAPALASAWALGCSIERENGTRLRAAGLAAAGCALATLATPAGFSFPALACRWLELDRDLPGLVAIHPIDVAPVAYRVGFTLVAVGALVFGSRFRRVDLPLLGLAVPLALANGAFLPLLGTIAAPPLAAAARLPRGAAALLSLLAACSVVASSLAAQRSNTAPPSGLVGVLARSGVAHRVFCEPLEWCSTVTAQGSPRLRVFMDGRVALYSPALRREQRAIARVHRGWQAQAAAAGIDAFLVTRRGALATLLGLDPRWRSPASDDRAVLYVRRGLEPR